MENKPDYTNKKLLVEIKSLSKRYVSKKANRFDKKTNIKNRHKDKYFYAVDDISGGIYSNDRIGIVGANGCGKSTLVNIIAQAIKATKGKVNYFFEKGGPNHNIGIQFQENIYPNNINVKDILNFYKTIYRDKITKDSFDSIVKIFKMEELYKNKVVDLSGGQKQRLNILIALMHQPQLIILDEISTGLDISIQETISKFIKQLVNKYNLTLLIVSHNVFEITTLCSRIWLMKKGKIIADLTLDEIIAKYNNFEIFLRKNLHGNTEDNLNVTQTNNHLR